MDRCIYLKNSFKSVIYFAHVQLHFTAPSPNSFSEPLLCRMNLKWPWNKNVWLNRSLTTEQKYIGIHGGYQKDTWKKLLRQSVLKNDTPEKHEGSSKELYLDES